MTSKQIKTAKTHNNSRYSSINLIFKPIELGLNIISYIVISIIINTTIEWLSIIFDIFPYNHAQQILQIEISYLSNNFTTTLFGISAQELIDNILSIFTVYLHSTPNNSSDAIMISINWIKSLGNSFTPYINSLLYITMITATRCVIILLSISLFIIVGIAAMVDGLHIRELRKVGGDDEHGDVYHWAKASISKIITISPIIYLAYPSSINPNFVLLPGIIMFFIATFLFFSKYKKIL
ncbi:DUF4400 domain-containing protein [Pasteurella atlantica]|uniref:DUF4400 domain-containing protein n=2 Tax=Pasteurellaceae TaxID=712 RepID=A0ACC6HLH9_9PAST|nr:DUF4400 domain-containing protein [Pasteurella atlantica]MDP8051506.1 DUF4400 domain-containing protein [Pasteurella atlantica]MDP8104915.1 DUF4400 domain-containing protein [Pasteurella atlantica]MDP8148289.1 DUF4400 domain-containing protein [Pasteurella atlantica]